MLSSAGTSQSSFVPDRNQRELRDMTRFRKSQIEERSRNINRLQKFLESGNFKLGSWLSDIEGKSAGELLQLVIGQPNFSLDDVKSRMHGRATLAVAHSKAIAIFFVLSGFEFKDLGADYYTQFNRERKINSHVRQLSKLGVTIPDDAVRKLLRNRQILLLNGNVLHPLDVMQ